MPCLATVLHISSLKHWIHPSKAKVSNLTKDVLIVSHSGYLARHVFDGSTTDWSSLKGRDGCISSPQSTGVIFTTCNWKETILSSMTCIVITTVPATVTNEVFIHGCFL